MSRVGWGRCRGLGSEVLGERRVGSACTAAGPARGGRHAASPAGRCGAIGSRGRLAVPGLGGHAQGRSRPLEPTDGCQHDARGVEGLDPGLPASPVAAGVG